jgi:hypothetical protein
MEKWWRYEAKTQAHWDDDSETVTHYSYRGQYLEFTVLRHTPKGVFVKRGFNEQFVRGKGIKQLCVPTLEAAVADEIARRTRHVKGAAHRLNQAERLLDVATREMANSYPRGGERNDNGN